MTNGRFTKDAMLSFIDKQVEHINESQKLNFIRWDILNQKQFLQPTVRGSYEAEIKYIKEFIENRFSIFGQIVTSATTESVNAEVQGGWNNGGGNWGWPGWGNNDWGNNGWGNNGWGNNGWGNNGN